MHLRGLAIVWLCSVPTPHLDRLVLEERYAEAFSASVDELRRRLEVHGAAAPVTLEALHRVGVVAHLAGDQGIADDVLTATLDARLAALAPDDPMIAETLIHRGRAARYLNEREEARRDYDEARRILARREDAPPELRAQLLQAEADWQRGVDLDVAIDAYRASLALRRGSRREPDLASIDNLTWLAWTLHRAGRRAEALPLAAEARAQLDGLGLSAHSLRATLDNLHGESLAIDGDLRAAAVLFRATAATSEAARRKQPGGYARRGFPLDGYEPLALEALSRGRGEEAWTLVQRARAASHVDFATFAGWSRKDPVGWEEWRRLHGAMRTAKARAGKGDLATLVGTLELRARAHDLERRYLDAHRPVVPSLPEVQRLLARTQALVGVLEVNFGGDPSPTTAPQRSCAWAYVVRRDRPIAWVPLWDVPSREAYVSLGFSTRPFFESLRRAAAWRRRVDADPALATQARHWGRLVVDPMLPHLDGIEHIVSERLLEPLDLAVLPDGRMLGDVFDVSYVPSAMVFALLAEERPAPTRTPSILAVSGPSEPPSTSIGALVSMDEASRSQRQLRTAYRRDDTPLEKLPRLRFAALEAQAVAARFPRRTVLLDPRRSDPALERLAARGTLGEFSIVHIAAHTLTDDAPERCAMALGREAGGDEAADGLVEVEDILLGWRLNADLMTLSGCETLRAAGAGRGEPFGFTPALFGSGARRVLSSLWTVDDRATAILMDRFYENLTGQYAGERLGYRAAALPPARALREAKRFVRTTADANGRRPFEHPAYWAGFFLVGLP